QVARQMKRLALVRSMSTREGDHGRATYHLRTGYVQQGPIHYPALGAVLSKELGDTGAELPGFVSIAPARGVNPSAYGAGFLGRRMLRSWSAPPGRRWGSRILPCRTASSRRRPTPASVCSKGSSATLSPATPTRDRACISRPSSGLSA